MFMSSWVVVCSSSEMMLRPSSRWASVVMVSRAWVISLSCLETRLRNAATSDQSSGAFSSRRCTGPGITPKAGGFVWLAFTGDAGLGGLYDGGAARWA